MQSAAHQEAQRHFNEGVVQSGLRERGPDQSLLSIANLGSLKINARHVDCDLRLSTHYLVDDAQNHVESQHHSGRFQSKLDFSFLSD